MAPLAGATKANMGNVSLVDPPSRGYSLRHSALGALTGLLVLALAAMGGCVDNDGDGATGETPSKIGGDSPDPTSPGDSAPPAPGEEASDGGLPASARFFQMNDVSILLPLPKSVTERNSSMLNAGSAGVDGPLIDRALYAAVEADLLGDNEPGCAGCSPLQYDNLRLVAVRIDPCFAHQTSFHDDDTCRNELRLTFQPVVANPAGADGGTSDAGASDAGASDSFKVIEGAIQATYSISRSELIDIANAIVTLRIASGRPDALGPLAPHPIAVTEGLDGAFVRGLYGIIQAHASTNRLVRFGRMQHIHTIAGLSLFEVAAGVPTRTHIKMLPADSGTQSACLAQSLGDVFIAVIGPPATLSPDRYDAVMNTQYNAANNTAAERQAAFDAILRIDNPRIHTPETIDCASCHLASVTGRVVGPMFGLDPAGNPNLFTFASPFVTNADMSMTTVADPLRKPRPDPVTGVTRTNIYMFSYIDKYPSVTPRVINETAIIVDYLNSIPH